MAKTKLDAPLAVRVLADVHIGGRPYKAGSAVILSPELAAQHIDEGHVDPSPEAMAYVQSEGGIVIDHAAEEAAEAAAKAPKAEAEA